MTALTETGVWVYAVTRAAAHGELRSVTGVAGEPLRRVEHESLSAVVGTVGLSEFGEDALRGSLEDLEWLEGRARVHHAVIAALAGVGPVVPMRLAVVCHNDDRVRRMLHDAGPQLDASLDRISGRSEWGVKVYATDTAATRNESERPAPGTSTGRPGTAYLMRRQASLSAREEARRASAAAAASVYSALGRLAVASRRHRPQDAQLSGDPRPMLLNAAYLVDDDLCEGFAAAAGSLGGQPTGIQVEVTGPWPPYSFCALDAPES